MTTKYLLVFTVLIVTVLSFSEKFDFGLEFETFMDTPDLLTSTDLDQVHQLSVDYRLSAEDSDILLQLVKGFVTLGKLTTNSTLGEKRAVANVVRRWLTQQHCYGNFCGLEGICESATSNGRGGFQLQNPNLSPCDRMDGVCRAHDMCYERPNDRCCCDVIFIQHLISEGTEIDNSAWMCNRRRELQQALIARSARGYRIAALTVFSCKTFVCNRSGVCSMTDLQRALNQWIRNQPPSSNVCRI